MTKVYKIDDLLLKNVKWHLDSVHVSAKNSRVKLLNFDSTISILDCERDNYLFFDVSSVISYFGVNKCNDSEPDSIAENWSLKGNYLYFCNKQFVIKELQTTKLKLYWDTLYVAVQSGVQVKSTRDFTYYYSSIK